MYFEISPLTLTLQSIRLPHIVGRMGRLEAIDKKYFLIVAKDFYSNQVQI